VAASDDDDTIRVRAVPLGLGPPVSQPRQRTSRGRLGAFVGAFLAVLVVGLGGGAFVLLRPSPPAAPAVPSAPVRPAAFAIRSATEAEIRANTNPNLVIFRFAPNPRVLVLDFPDLHDQAMMLNRVAALIEKAGLPRDRVLTDPELNAAIAAHGDTPETYYYGHDYSAASLARFFVLADRDHVALSPQEQMLRRLLIQEDYLKPGSLGALISIPHAGLDPQVDATARATILHHELSHGEYFSNPAYANYARQFWKTGMSAANRAALTRFLTSQDYDSGDEDLMMNETQAYLMHTPDPRFFNARTVSMTDTALSLLQANFLLGMPNGWLRDCTSGPAPLAAKN
jgi:hypothetical protein